MQTSRLQFRTEIVVTPSANLRILLVIPAEQRREITRQLQPLNAELVFADPSGQTQEGIKEDDVFQVAILPATLTDIAWWKLWGMLGVLHKRPAILVYAREATFQLWSGVLESGGYDVIVEPFTGAEIRNAVRQAAESFEERTERLLSGCYETSENRLPAVVDGWVAAERSVVRCWPGSGDSSDGLTARRTARIFRDIRRIEWRSD